MSTLPKPRFTPEEYLARERQAERKSEYYQGEIFAMAGASREHNLISKNILVTIDAQLRERPCEVYPSDMRVKVSATGLYTYPDVTVVCGPPRFEDHFGDTLLNPTVLFEVLSESTETYNRGTKSKHYRQIASLREIVLVSQSEPQIECYTRVPEGGWKFDEAMNLNESLVLSSIDVRLPLAEIYRGVEFPPRDAELNPAPAG